MINPIIVIVVISVISCCVLFYRRAWPRLDHLRNTHIIIIIIIVIND